MRQVNYNNICMKGTMEQGKAIIKSSSYGEEIIKGINLLRNSDELCDFTVCADGRSFKV